jgi:low affinity Fe/Cu permease
MRAMLNRIFARAANAVAYATGRPITFIVCCLAVIVWGATGPTFHYSDTWQLVINTGTTIVTFLMVFLIQNTQNRESAALHAKLDEVIRALEKAENRFIGLEQRDEGEISELRAEHENPAAAPLGSSAANQISRGPPS